MARRNAQNIFNRVAGQKDTNLADVSGQTWQGQNADMAVIANQNNAQAQARQQARTQEQVGYAKTVAEHAPAAWEGGKNIFGVGGESVSSGGEVMAGTGDVANTGGGGMSGGQKAGYGAAIGIGGQMLAKNQSAKGNSQAARQIGGASQGAAAGMSFGPWGALVGGAIGNELGRGEDMTSSGYWKDSLTMKHALDDTKGIFKMIGIG